MALLTVFVLPVFFTFIAGLSVGVGGQALIVNTLQTVKDQKTEIAEVGDFWTSLVSNFIEEGISQASEECQEKLGTKCTSDILTKIATCVNSSSINDDVSKALSSFTSPLLSELKGIENDLKDPNTEQKVIENDVWTMDLTRTDEDSFVYKKNKAQSEFIVNVNPIADKIPATASSCFEELSALN